MAGRKRGQPLLPSIPKRPRLQTWSITAKPCLRKHRGFFQPLAEPLVRNLRLIKDEDELRLMKQAARLGRRPVP